MVIKFAFQQEVYELKICNKCRRECEYRNKKFKDVSLYCDTHCTYDLKVECDKIATEDFRKVIQELKDGNFSNAAVNGILKQAQCILNVADEIMEE